MKRSTARGTTAMAAAALIALPSAGFAQASASPQSQPQSQTEPKTSPPDRSASASQTANTPADHVREAKQALSEIQTSSVPASARGKISQIRTHLNNLEKEVASGSAAESTPAAGAASKSKASPNAASKWGTDVAAVDKNDGDIGEDRAQIAPDRLLVGGKLGNRFVDERELFGRGQAIGAALGDAFADLGLDTGHADHEELIKVICRNRQESHPLQHGMAAIDRFLEHAAIEVQPGELAIDESFGTLGNRRDAGLCLFFFFYFNGLRGVHEESIHLFHLFCDLCAKPARTMC